MPEIRFTTGERWDVVDADCEFRPCFRGGLDKGPFTPGVGYTSYYPKPFKVCMARHLYGCPTVGATLKCDGCGGVAVEGQPCGRCGSTETYLLHDLLPDPEPCCDNPDVPRVAKGRRPPYVQRCRSCRKTLKGKRLEMAQEARAAA